MTAPAIPAPAEGPARQRPASPPGCRVARRPPRPAHGRRDRQRPRPLGRRGRQRADHPGRPGRGQPPRRQAAALRGQRRDRRRSRRHHPQGPRPAQGRPRRAQAGRLAAPPAAPKPAAPPAPPAAPKAPAPKAAPGPVTRPGGQVYRPRVLAGMADVEALRTLRAEGVPSLLSGPPGTGKTSLVEAAFPDLITVAGDGDTTVGDFVGEYTQKPDGTYEFIYGPLIRAMQEGRVLFIDDATLISPAVLAVCYPAMDGRREVIVKAHKGETITAADGFYVVAGHNPGVHGAVLTEALSSRFTFQFEVATDYDLARSLGIDSRAITAARNLATRQANGETGWAPQLRELLAFAKITQDLRAGHRAGQPRRGRPRRGPRRGRRHPRQDLRQDRRPARPRPPDLTPPPCPGRSAVMSATPPAPAPDNRPRPAAAWLAFSAQMTAQVAPVAGRADLTVTVAPGAGRGAPGLLHPGQRRDRGQRRPPAASTPPPPTPPTRPTASATPPCGARPCTSARTPPTPAGAPPRARTPPGRPPPPRWRSPGSRPARSPAARPTGPGCAPAPARS